jgi:hypothetical protein
VYSFKIDGGLIDSFIHSFMHLIGVSLRFPFDSIPCLLRKIFYYYNLSSFQYYDVTNILLVHYFIKELLFSVVRCNLVGHFQILFLHTTFKIYAENWFRTYIQYISPETISACSTSTSTVIYYGIITLLSYYFMTFLEFPKKIPSPFPTQFCRKSNLTWELLFLSQTKTIICSIVTIHTKYNLHSRLIEQLIE